MIENMPKQFDFSRLGTTKVETGTGKIIEKQVTCSSRFCILLS